MNCRSCETELVEFFSLGQIPSLNLFLKKEEDFASEKKYNLSVGFCPKCFLVQIIDIISPEDLFRDYIYFSSVSKYFLEHCKENADYLAKKLNLDKESLVLEIASNDGSQLQCFKELGIPVLGVDPAKNIAKVANEKGIRTIDEFFSYPLAKKLKEEQNVQADLIFGANVLAHVPEIVGFVKGVKELLKPKGTAVFEFPYVQGLVENKFDIIYHEHVFYYSLIALIHLFKSVDLEIYDVKMTPMQGGSLMIFASHSGVLPIHENVKNLKAKEIESGFDKLETYQKMSESVLAIKHELVDLLKKLKREGKRVAAYSAPARGNILLLYFGIDGNYLDFIVDKSKAKQGLYTPGTHLLVYPPEKISEEKPDYLLILCWNLADEVMQMEELKNWRQNGGKFIIPIPEIKIV
ncbi:MAG: methyltransferase domain-containing protein [Candidatus Staskawiczbacteria bacterium]|nr:methyltransferase domain-containing protein [Candidatus Staskawiczbacteria bacterium]MBI3337242.1 methyltransferase domain-containing protein [Candidatus Staskawiczbacteria bacterium]